MKDDKGIHDERTPLCSWKNKNIDKNCRDGQSLTQVKNHLIQSYGSFPDVYPNGMELLQDETKLSFFQRWLTSERRAAELERQMFTYAAE